MNEQANRYPLSWPLGWVRTEGYRRARAAFSKSVRAFDPNTQQVVKAAGTRRLTVSDAISRLSGELSRLGATNEILSTNVVTRLDGLPRSNQPEPADPGAAVYFRLKGRDTVLACDRWDRVADNIAAIAQHIDALRRIDRYGVGTMEQAFAGYRALPAAATEWWVILGLTPNASREQVEEAHRTMARKNHPDLGGSPEVMARINAARDAALKGFAA